jgi:trk system potassium uptake protein TrkA
MKILIIGAGEVGNYLAKLLEKEKHSIVLIDKDTLKLDYVKSTLGIATICGDATSYKILKEAGANSADVVLSVSSSESVNILAAGLCKQFGC